MLPGLHAASGIVSRRQCRSRQSFRVMKNIITSGDRRRRIPSGKIILSGKFFAHLVHHGEHSLLVKLRWIGLVHQLNHGIGIGEAFGSLFPPVSKGKRRDNNERQTFSFFR